MSKQTINIGASPNDGTGTPLRTSFDYTNQNFTEIYTALGGGVALPGATTQVIFNDGGTNLAGDAGLVYNKTTDALTVAGLVTAGSAAITGDLTVDTSTLKVDSTNNRVGIGTATPSFTLDVRSATAVFKLESTAGTTAAYLYATNTGGDFYFGRDNSTGTTFGTGTGYSAVVYSANAVPMVFFTNATERARITTSGDVSIANGNLVMATSGKGIDFSATAGTGTSELLNDYEEGTWTGTVTGGTFTNLTTGRYTKIGRQVFATITPNTSAITGNIVISGLPFTAGARSAMVVATTPPTGVTYIPLFVDSTDIYVNVTGTYAAGSVSTYFAFTYDV
jgi:hypothetical protein